MEEHDNETTQCNHCAIPSQTQLDLGVRNGQYVLGHTNHCLARIGSLSGYAAETRDDLPLAAIRAANGNCSTLEQLAYCHRKRQTVDNWQDLLSPPAATTRN
jgi:hypothetical protein